MRSALIAVALIAGYEITMAVIHMVTTIAIVVLAGLAVVVAFKAGRTGRR